jgi:hypothetical protein
VLRGGSLHSLGGRRIKAVTVAKLVDLIADNRLPRTSSLFALRSSLFSLLSLSDPGSLCARHSSRWLTYLLLHVWWLQPRSFTSKLTSSKATLPSARRATLLTSYSSGAAASLSCRLTAERLIPARVRVRVPRVRSRARYDSSASDSGYKPRPKYPLFFHQTACFVPDASVRDLSSSRVLSLGPGWPIRSLCCLRTCSPTTRAANRSRQSWDSSLRRLSFIDLMRTS